MPSLCVDAACVSGAAEHNDLGEDARYTKIVDTMIARMEALQPFVYDPDRGKPEVEAACAKLEENGGFCEFLPPYPPLPLSCSGSPLLNPPHLHRVGPR